MSGSSAREDSIGDVIAKMPLQASDVSVNRKPRRAKFQAQPAVTFWMRGMKRAEEEQANMLFDLHSPIRSATPDALPIPAVAAGSYSVPSRLRRRLVKRRR